MTEKSWPFQEARSLLSHIERKGKRPGDVVTFETGYGPSGAPHIGTFGEVIRTLMVMRAFDTLTGNAYQTRLIMFSDDYDGFRAVPEGMPESMKQFLGRPLSSVPDPAHTGMSFAQVNNSILAAFVNRILADRGESSTIAGTKNTDFTRFQFVSSTQRYQSGEFNRLLELVHDKHQEILDIMLPTLGEERAATYCAFMPIHNDVVVHHGVRLSTTPGWVEYTGPTANGPADSMSARVTSGTCKLQWKVDWAMRWVHFDVDYEMCGKDLTDSVRASSQICRVLGGTPPQNMIYELFLDKDGKKISKKLGNGLTLEQWAKYGSRDALAAYMFQSPKSAKSLHSGIIPKVTDEYAKHVSNFNPKDRDSVVWHVSCSNPPVSLGVSYGLMLNLAQVSKATEPSVLMDYLEQYRPIEPTQRRIVLEMAAGVINYARDHGLLERELREPTVQEGHAFLDLACRFQLMMPGLSAEAFQYQVYEVGKVHGFDPLRDWFKALYEVLLGESSGPRFGAFTIAYGVEKTIRLLVDAAAKVVDVSGFNAIVARQEANCAV